MGFLKKITRPISRVLDKIVPNEIKPALPFLAAAAPFMAPGIMGAFGNSMLSRGLISGGLNLGSQLAQEGSDGEFDALSLAMASGIGALSAPGTSGGRTLPDGSGGSYSQVMGGNKLASVGNQSAGDYLRGLSDTGGITDQSLNFLGTGADKLQGLQQGLAADGIFSKAGAKALSIPLTQGTYDLAVAENRRLEKQQAIDDAEASAAEGASDAQRAAAIRQSMEAYGFTDDEIEDAIYAAGYKIGGRVGFEFGGITDAVEAVEETPKEFLVDKLKVTVQPGQSEEMGILNAMFNDTDGVMSDDRKMEFYKLYLPQLYERGEITKEQYEGMKQDIFDEDIPKMAEGGLMNLGGREMDMRGGGFIPIGKKERADDVPARLSKNEFVMTADAVRAAGGGSVNEGAKRMYETMNRLEAKSIMSTTTTITKPAPVIEGSLTAFLKSIDKLGAGAIPAGGFTGIDPSKYKPTIADQSQLQIDARKAAEGLGALTGPDAYKQYMSPYQQEVIDTTLSEFDRQQTIANTARRDQAIQAGAYGGGREGVLAAEAARGASANRANLQAQLLAQGFQQAQAAAAQDLAAQQGLGQYQQQMGQAGQAQQQAILDAAAAAEREQQFQPFTQLGLIGQQLAQIQPGAFPTQTVGYAPPAAPASPLATALGVGTGVASIGSKLGLFG